MTNGDRFRTMTDAELAVAIMCPYPGCVLDDEKFDEYGCVNCTLDWLKEEIPTPPQKKPLCDTCKHAIDGVVDDFAAVFCAARLGYFGQVVECKDYAPKGVSDNG